MSAPVLVALFTFIDGLTQGIYGTIFNLMLRTGGLPTSAVGNITSSNLWGAAFIGLFFGLVAEKYEKKTLLIMTQLLSIFFGTYRIFATSSTILGITSFFHGGFSAVTATIMSTILVMKTSSENRARFLGLNLSAGMFTGVIANVVGGLLGDAFGFRSVLLFSSLSRILALYPILKLDATSSSANEESDEAPSIASFSKIFKIRDSKEVKTILYYFLSNVNVGLGAGLFVVFGNVIFYDLFHMSATVIGLILAFAQLATSLGAMFSYKIGRKFGDMNVLIFSYVFVPILIVLLSFTREPITFTSVYILRFAVMNMVGPLLSSVVFSHIPMNIVSSINGVNNFLNNVSRALSAVLFSVLTKFENGYTLIFIISSIFYFLNAYVMIRLRKHLGE
ncbi:MAG TPA: MFS transporter [Fervidobacterium sp.]|nr:MFS transporter [Fervidobacterium sp.]